MIMFYLIFKVYIVFSIPKDAKRREAWRVALNVENEDIFTNSNVCHLHFTEESYDFQKSPFAIHLKRDALPVVVSILVIFI